jgi:large subunit ribosomal protein L29
MKIDKLTEMSKNQLQEQLSSFQDSLLNLKFQKNLQQLEDTSQLSKTRRSIAQIKTILNNFNLKKKTNQGDKK